MNYYASFDQKPLFEEDVEITVYLRFNSIKKRNQFLKDEPTAKKLSANDKQFRKIREAALERMGDHIETYTKEKVRYWYPTKSYDATHVLI